MPLWMIARWNRPLACGVPRRIRTDSAPADSLKTVTLPWLPPNWAMLLFTQRRAAIWSSMPAFPLPLNALPFCDSSVNPNSPSRYWTVTTTASPRLASAAPSRKVLRVLPQPKAPPWMNTMTGRFLVSERGVHTLSERQSSDWTSAPFSVGSYSEVWMHAGPGAVADRTPFQAACSTGALKRRAPTGAAAYGIDR